MTCQQSFHPSRVFLLAICALIAAAPLAAQSVPQSIPQTILALFLSDIHLDPYADPAKVAKLNASPVAEWPAIFSTPPSLTQAADFAALQTACPVRGVDTPNLLWQSSLRAIHANAAGVRFVTVSGDLLAHQFDCKYRTLLPTATHADYLAFVEKTARYIVSSLRQSLPGVPVYIAMGNNDSGCTDYALAPAHDDFLGLTAKIVAEALPADLPSADRTSVLSDFAAGGYYNVPLAGIPHTRLIVLDDLFLSASYATCARKHDPAPGAAQLAWLSAQLSDARQHNDRVWVLGHIPPGVNLYASARKLLTLCGGSQPEMFLGSEKLEEILAANSDVVRLALFGHTHSDEMRLLMHEPGPASPHLASGISDQSGSTPGVPLKIVASITPVNGNNPTFTLARINPASATLVDYTVIMASNLTGDATKWAPEYTYSATYHQPAFDAASVLNLIGAFQADPAAKSSSSQAYLRNYYPGDISTIIQIAWLPYVCSMDNDSAAAFAACACRTAAPPQ